MNPPSVISEDVRRKIIAEPSDVPYQQIADKYGVTWYHVKNIRMKAGVHNAAKTQGRKTNAIERVIETVVIEAGTHFDRAIEAIDEQIVIYQQAREVLVGLRAAAKLV